jgi:hypothetical protein
VFSRAAAEAGATARVRESEHRLRQEQELLANDARHLADAVSAVGAAALSADDTAPSADMADATRQVQAPEFRPALIEASTLVRARQPSLEREEPVLNAPDDMSAAPETTTAHEVAAQQTAARRPKILLPALAGMGLLTIILLLPTLSDLDMDADGKPSPAGTTPPRISTEIVTLGATGNVTDPLAVLERPQNEADRPPEGFPTSIPLGNFRGLPDLVGHVRLYLARNEPASVCLVVVQPRNQGMTGCMPESNFTEDGLQLSGGRYEVDSFMTILTESYSLLPSGDFEYHATARVRERMAPPAGGSPEDVGPDGVDPGGANIGEILPEGAP